MLRRLLRCRRYTVTSSLSLVIPAKAGIQLLICLRSSFPRRRESSAFAFVGDWEQKLPLQGAGNFLLNGKKSPKNVLFSHIRRCPQTARPCCWLRTRASLRATTLATSLRVTGIKLLVKIQARSQGGEACKSVYAARSATGAFADAICSSVTAAAWITEAMRTAL